MPGLSNNQHKTQYNYRAASYRVQSMLTTSIRYLWTMLYAVDTMSPLLGLVRRACRFANVSAQCLAR
jgi:hypothetical protein